MTEVCPTCNRPILARKIGEELANAQRIIDIIADLTLIPTPGIFGPSRDGKFVRARYLAILLVVSMTMLSRDSIAQLFGRDPSTISWAMNRAQYWVNTDPHYRQLWELAIKEITK